MGARQRKGGGDPIDAGKGEDTGDAAPEKLERRAPPRKGTVWLVIRTCQGVTAILLLIGLVAAVVLAYMLNNNVTVSIHSCDVFFPKKLASLSGAGESLMSYARNEGAWTRTEPSWIVGYLQH